MSQDPGKRMKAQYGEETRCVYQRPRRCKQQINRDEK